MHAFRSSFSLLCIIKAQAHYTQIFSPWPPARLHVSLIWCVYPVSHSAIEVLFFSLNVGPHLWYAELQLHTPTVLLILQENRVLKISQYDRELCVCVFLGMHIPCSAAYALRLACFCASIQLALLWAAVLIAAWMVSAKCFVTVWKHEREEVHTRKGIPLFFIFSPS